MDNKEKDFFIYCTTYLCDNGSFNTHIRDILMLFYYSNKNEYKVSDLHLYLDKWSETFFKYEGVYDKGKFDFCKMSFNYAVNLPEDLFNKLCINMKINY